MINNPFHGNLLWEGNESSFSMRGMRCSNSSYSCYKISCLSRTIMLLVQQFYENLPSIRSLFTLYRAQFKKWKSIESIITMERASQNLEMVGQTIVKGMEFCHCDSPSTGCKIHLPIVLPFKLNVKNT